MANIMISDENLRVTQPEMLALGRVLYADDEAASRIMISELLRRLGYDCETAPDALVAARMLRESSFDCLVSDINMLGNAELEFIREVQLLNPGLPVILVTAYPSVSTAVESLKLPVMAYLLKPVESSALAEAVREAISRSRLLQHFEATRASLERWLGEVSHLASGLRAAPRVLTAGPMDAYLMLTYRNTLDALLGLKSVLEHALSANSQDETRLPKGPSPLLLIDALRNAIDILEKTKDSFRSRELGDLRRQLEDLLLNAKKQKHEIER